MSERTHDDVVELLGAYALHAVDPAERIAVEEHLVSCPRCRAELRDHEAVAGLLGNSGAAAPDGVWDRIASALDETAPPMRLDLPAGEGIVLPLGAGRRAARRRWLVAVAAAALVVGALGWQVLRQEDRISSLQAAVSDEGMLRAANLALRDPSAERVSLRSQDGALAASAVLLPDGTGYLLVDDLPELRQDRTYQLWGKTDRGLISLGVLGRQPSSVMPFEAGSGVDALAITEEDAPGVVQSTHAPVLAGDVT